MAINFHDVQFPTDVSYGSRGGPEFKTQIYTAYHGNEKRNIEWSQPLMRFNVAYGIKTTTQMRTVIDFYNARGGRANAFRYKNWQNYNIVSGPIAPTDGSSQRFPLYKFFGLNGFRTYKRLYKIVPGSVKDVGVAAPGNLVEGTDYIIDYELGEIAINTVPAFGVGIFGSLEFDEPVRFDVDNLDILIEAYNNNSLTDLPLVGVRDPFPSSRIFAPNQANAQTDPYRPYTNLLLNFDAIATPTTLTDRSPKANAMTVVTDARQVSTGKASGSGSLQVGTGRVTTAGTNFNLATQMPFTLELYAQQPTTGLGDQMIIGKWDETTNQRSWQLRYNFAAKTLEFRLSTNGTTVRTAVAAEWPAGTAGEFDAISIDRLASGWYVMRIKGQVVASARDTTAINDGTAGLTIGHINNPTATQGPFTGLIDAVRLTAGFSRYNTFENINPPLIYPLA